MRAGLDGERDRQIGLSHPGKPQEDDVLVLFDELHVEERHDLFFVQLGVEAEVVLLDVFCSRQPGGLHGNFK